MVVDEIKKAGGKAVANYDSVENGENIINTAIQSFGGIDILINNAGILRDVSIKNMQDKDWDLIMSVHITGAYKVGSRTAEWTWVLSLTRRAVHQSSLATLQETKVWQSDQYSLCCRPIRQLWPDKLLGYAPSQLRSVQSISNKT